MTISGLIVTVRRGGAVAFVGLRADGCGVGEMNKDRLVKKFVRLALASEYTRQPLKRGDITSKGWFVGGFFFWVGFANLGWQFWARRIECLKRFSNSRRRSYGGFLEWS